MKLTRAEYEGLMLAVDGYESVHGEIGALRAKIASSVEILSEAPVKRELTWVTNGPGRLGWRTVDGAYEIKVLGERPVYRAFFRATCEVVFDSIRHVDAMSACEAHARKLRAEVRRSALLACGYED